MRANSNLETQFKNYLTREGYSVTTPSGNPSTVYDYAKRIARVCDEENITWAMLARSIVTTVAKYDLGGAKEEAGSQSNKAVINALKRYQDFIELKKNELLNSWLLNED